jgi:hypothetical protein
VETRAARNLLRAVAIEFGTCRSQSRRAIIECIFGWGKQHATMRKTKHCGTGRVAANFLLNLIA